MSLSSCKSGPLISSSDMARIFDALTDNLLKRYSKCRDFALIGIQRRGVSIAEELCDRMSRKLGISVPAGSLDITLYRDDWTTKGPKPSVGETLIRFDVEGKNLVLVDDVLYTGRTVRAALEALADFGRPSKIELLVLVDRGHRELPIHADYVGVRCPTDKGDHVNVLMREIDGEQGVRLVTRSVAT
ncbi:MAG: bifunctional pyr operon transcriptional regulator/uracil phosphoribosyltransferase PyrR [Desulfovibrio sp.]|nr:bifunctional pyr operon transcriptional regulator/uracil phosphoribosyltransferase PyrR [Desulfovibrio sp.]